MTRGVHDRHDRQLITTTPTRPILRSQRLRLINHQGDALRLGMNWTEEDLGKPQVLVDSVYGTGHPGTFHFRELIEEVSNRVAIAAPEPGSFCCCTTYFGHRLRLTLEYGRAGT